MQVTLEVIGKNSNVKRVILKGNTTIGRGGDCHLKIVSSQVSRKHCQIDIENNRVTICDLGSANGTFIDNSQLLPDEKVDVQPGAVVKLGNVSFLLQFKPDKAQLAFEEEGSTLELAAYKDAQNLKQVNEQLTKEQPAIHNVEENSDAKNNDAVKQVDDSNMFVAIEDEDNEAIDISTADVPDGEPISVILEAVDVEEAIANVIVEDAEIDEDKMADIIVEAEEDVIELEPVIVESNEPNRAQLKPEEIKPIEGAEKEAVVSDDDIADFLTDLENPEASTGTSKTDLNNFLDQFE